MNGFRNSKHVLHKRKHYLNSWCLSENEQLILSSDEPNQPIDQFGSTIRAEHACNRS